MSGVSLIALCSPPAARNLPQAAALFRPGALSSLKAGRTINGISLQQISHSVYTAGLGAGLSYSSRNSQDSNVFPSGRVLMLCILFLWLSIHDSLRSVEHFKPEPQKHTHTHTQTYIYTNTHTRTHKHSHIHAHVHKHTHTQTLTYTHLHTQKLFLSLTHTADNKTWLRKEQI